MDRETQGHPIHETKDELTSAESHRAIESARSKMNAMDFSDWAAQPVPHRSQTTLPSRAGLDLGAFKIFLILAGLTAGMALALRSLF